MIIIFYLFCLWNPRNIDHAQQHDEGQFGTYNFITPCALIDKQLGALMN